MKVTRDIHEFYRTTGIIVLRPRLRELGFLTNDVTGTFRPCEMDDIRDFCAQNPAFHVVTYLGLGLYINRYEIRGNQFKLAEGNANPNYMLDARPFIHFALPGFAIDS